MPNNIILQAALAARMLLTRRSYSAARPIAIVAIIGVAVATTAIICVLSVFNGFQSVLTSNLNRMAPDVIVTPAEGKTFNADSLMRAVGGIKGVVESSPVLSDNALALYEAREMPVTLRGVDIAALRRRSEIDSLLVAGESLGHKPQQALLSVGAATQLSFYHMNDHVLLFAPRRIGRINTANPVSSFITDSVEAIGVFESRQPELDENTIYTDIDVARRLFNRPGEASALEISVDANADETYVAEEIGKALGPRFIVKDRQRQADTNFRMVQIEKWVSFLLLFFILVIASFNIVSTLCMIVLDKQRSMSALHSMGMSRRDIGGIFFWQSLYIALAGGVAGMLLGLALCLLQQNFGLISIASDPDADMMISSYPVKVEAIDFLATLAPLLIIGMITGVIASSFARSRLTMTDK